MTAELHAAFVAAQAQFLNPPKTKTAQAGSYSYRYAGLPEIVDAVRPVLAEHGLAFTQSVSAADGMVGVKTLIVHRSGEVLESSVLWLPAGETPQQAGSAITYARRYSLCAALGIVADEDDDAAQVKPKPKRKTSGAAAGVGKAGAAPDPPSAGEAPEALSPNESEPATSTGSPRLSTPPTSSSCEHRNARLDREASRAAGHRVDSCPDCGEVFDLSPVEEG